MQPFNVMYLPSNHGWQTFFWSVDWAWRLNEWLPQSPFLLIALSFCGVGRKMKSAHQNQEHLMNWNNRER